MRKNNRPKGVLSESYAKKRELKNELSFRYRVRGEAVCWAIKTFLDQSLRGNLSLLDMGAAEGKTLKYINEQLSLNEGVGIEYNPDLIAKAPSLPSHMRLEQGDVTNLCRLGGKSVSAVTALALLEHLPDPLLAVQEAARLLQSGGLFIASSPVPFWDHLSVRLGLLAEDQHTCDMHAAFFRSLFKSVPTLKLLCFKKFMWAPIGFLPYVKIQISPKRAFEVDGLIEKMKVMNGLFVNQLAVAMKE